MEADIKRLKSKRKSLYEKLADLGNFRRGTISVNYRKCGKKTAPAQSPGIRGMGHNIYGTRR